MKNQSDLLLVKPEEKFLPSYLLLCRESFHNVHNTYLLHDPEKFEEWKTTIFQRYEMEEKGIDLPEGFLPSATFWAILKKDVAGVVNIRLGMNEHLKEYGGQAGFMLSTSFRGQGLALPLLLLTIEKTRELGFSPVLMSCVDENLPSLRTLQKVPAVKVEKSFAMADGKYCPIHRFWF